jgi:glycerol kinase
MNTDRCLTAVLDIGTSSIRGSLFSAEGAIVHTTQIPAAPRFRGPGLVEQDPLVWRNGVISALSGCSAYAARIGAAVEAVSVTAFRSPVFPADRAGNPLHPALMWQDRRSSSLLAEVLDAEPEVFAKTGLRISPVFSAIKMLWCIRSLPELAGKTAKYLGVYEYVLQQLTGEYVTDHSVASRSNLFNIHSRSWDRELLDLFEVGEEKLCRLLPPGSVCGKLTEASARDTGLRAGIPVICAGGDQQNASVGLGVIEPGTTAANTGTGSYVIGIADRPVIDPGMGIFCNAASVPGKYIVEASVLTSGTIYRWFGEQFYDKRQDETSGELFARIDREILSSPPGAHGVLVIPHFEGSGSPDWNPRASGMFCNLTLSATRGDCARAILEGIAAEMALNIELMDSLTERTDRISVSGGMSRFDEFNRIQADLFGRPVIRYECLEATSVGAWIASEAALGHAENFAAAFRRLHPPGSGAYVEYRPRPEHAETYTRLRRMRREAEERFRR